MPFLMEDGRQASWGALPVLDAILCITWFPANSAGKVSVSIHLAILQAETDPTVRTKGNFSLY